jgi:hypothetical protein
MAILGSWKDIASYLGKGVRTVQRWERTLNLPVRRPPGAKRGVVMAFPAELDAWARRHPEGDGDGAERPLARQFKRNSQAGAELAVQARRLQELTGILLLRCRELAKGLERRNAARVSLSSRDGGRYRSRQKLLQDLSKTEKTVAAMRKSLAATAPAASSPSKSESEERS